MKIKVLILTATFFLMIGCGGASKTLSGSSNGNSNTQEQGGEQEANDTKESISPLEALLRSGDIKKDIVPTDDLIKEAIVRVDTILEPFSEIDRLFESGDISYEPKKNSQIFDMQEDSSTLKPILKGSKGNILAVASNSGSRVILYGGEPFSDENYKRHLKKQLNWLSRGDSSSSKAVGYVTLKKSIKSRIASNYPNWTLIECKDSDNSCFKNRDLLILESGNGYNIDSSLKEALDNNVSILFIQDNWNGDNDIAKSVANAFDFVFPNGGNWWKDDKVEVNSLAELKATISQNSELNSLKVMLTHLLKKDYNFDWSRCKNNKGEYGENYDDCKEVVGLKSEFEDGASKARELTNYLDSNKRDIFSSKNYRLQKLLVLIGDKLREGVSYPMDKVKSNQNSFFASLFADSVVYNYRKIDYKQQDMGNFSRSDFSHITPTDRVVDIVTKSPFRSTGAYALPGQRFRVTRLDNNSSVTLYIFINTLRPGATHQYQKDGYKRPKYLKSSKIRVDVNESVELTSPYGGPIELASNISGAEVRVKFENVGEHPYWSEFDKSPNRDEKFANALNANEYDWAEIATNSFEVHSKREKLIKSLSDIRWKSASKLAEATKIYASSYPMSLAGYRGEGIEVIDEVKSFADSKNIPIYKADFVKHMNSDQAACGSGCSGNPYDAYWAFNPIGHGDIHEIGHSLERANFRLAGWELHSSTNYYAYYTQMRYNQYVQNSDEIVDKSSYYYENYHIKVKVFKDVFSKINQAVNEDNPQEYLQKNLWANSNYSSQSLFMIEAMMYAQKYASGDYALSNGFHLLSRLHILDRYLSKDAKKDWENSKERLGFSNYTLDEIKAINSNDWLVVSLSYATGLDYRPFFDMYGEPYSQKASEQVASFNFPKVKKVFFAQKSDSGFIMPDDGSGAYLDKAEISVDGNSTYPY